MAITDKTINIIYKNKKWSYPAVYLSTAAYNIGSMIYFVKRSYM